MVREAAGRGSYRRGVGGKPDLKVGSRTESWKSSSIPGLTTACRRLPTASTMLQLPGAASAEGVRVFAIHGGAATCAGAYLGQTCRQQPPSLVGHISDPPSHETMPTF